MRHYCSFKLGLFADLLFFTIVTSCKDDVDYLPIADSSVALSSTYNPQDTPLGLISKNIALSQSATTRANGDYAITPYTIDADTILYLVNYRNGGCDVYSARFQAPMLLMHTNSNNIDLSDICNNSSEFSSLIDDFAQLVYHTDLSMEMDESWKMVQMASSSNGIPPIAPDTLISGPGLDPFDEDSLFVLPVLGNGHWLIDTIATKEDTNVIDHLIQDHWSQLEPYNRYIPYDTINPELHGAVGCVAVATTQYLHFLHQKDGIVPPAYSSATYDSIQNKYIFQNESRTIWDHLPCDISTSNNANIDSLALALGYISSYVCYDHLYGGTPGKMDSIVGFLNHRCGLSYSHVKYNSDYVIDELLSGYPVIVTGYGQMDGNVDSHCFLVDSYKNERTSISYVYKWVGTDRNGLPTNLFDLSGKPITFRYVYHFQGPVFNEPFIRMNLGRGYSPCDNVWVNTTNRWQFRSTYWYVVSQSRMIKKNSH